MVPLPEPLRVLTKMKELNENTSQLQPCAALTDTVPNPPFCEKEKKDGNADRLQDCCMLADVVAGAMAPGHNAAVTRTMEIRKALVAPISFMVSSFSR